MDLRDPLPPWAQTLGTLLVGAGGAKLLAVWLENRRLSKKEYRETLLDQVKAQIGRIEDLERCVGGLQVRVGNLRVEIAHLQESLQKEHEANARLSYENDALRARLEDLESGDTGDVPLLPG